VNEEQYMAGADDWDKALEEMKQATSEMSAIEVNENDVVNRKRGFGCRLWLIIPIVIVLFIGLMISIGFISGYMEGTRLVPGDASNFDPSVELEAVQRFAGDDVRFLEMMVNYIRPDGTMDLNASYKPSVEYVFVRLSDDQPAGVPVGAPGYRGDDAIYEYVIVEINPPFRNISVTTNGSTSGYVDLGMSRSIRSVPPSIDLPENVSPPTCEVEQLWQIAKSYDAPEDNAVATIKYTHEGYHFMIRDVNVDLKFTEECVVVQP
jgi:hypothetical protein